MRSLRPRCRIRRCVHERSGRNGSDTQGVPGVLQRRHLQRLQALPRHRHGVARRPHIALVRCRGHRRRRVVRAAAHAQPFHAGRHPQGAGAHPGVPGGQRAARDRERPGRGKGGRRRRRAHRPRRRVVRGSQARAGTRCNRRRFGANARTGPRGRGFGRVVPDMRAVVRRARGCAREDGPARRGARRRRRGGHTGRRHGRGQCRKRARAFRPGPYARG